MSTIFKDTRQEQFSAMMHTMNELGYRAADVARFLNVTHGAVSQYLSGRTNPSETVLGLFRRVVDERRGDSTAGEKGDVKEQLENLRRFAPADYAVAKATISMLHKKLPWNPSSKAGAAAGRMLKKGAASARKHSPK